MRIAIYGRNIKEIKEILKHYPFEITDSDPDVVICHGGDGTLLGAENLYPGITKCPIRDDKHNPKCNIHTIKNILDLLIENKLSTTIADRLVAEVDDCQEKRVIGLNDICINKANIASAMRFRLLVNNQIENSQVVGDGLIISTVFGSTGYFRSITKGVFRIGIGIAFNNSTEPLDHLVLPTDSQIEVEVLRGPAVLLADNHTQRIPLDLGSKIKIYCDTLQTTILGLEIFRCKDCFNQRSNGNNLYSYSNTMEY